MRQDSILIVDDQEINRFLLKSLFVEEYRILEAVDGEEALDMVEKEKENLDVILLDIIMPKKTGFEVMEELIKRGYGKNIPVVFITGDESTEVQERGFDLGIADFIMKPFVKNIVYKRVKNAIALYRYQNELEAQVQEQTRKIEQQAQKVKENQLQVLNMLTSVVEFRDLESGDHINRIKEFVHILAERMKEQYPEYQLTERQIDKITTASMVHDLGKIAIPDEILLKPGKLTKEEFEIMKTHTVKGCQFLEKASFLDDKEFYQYCYQICRSHHEKYDGNGYPDGLSKDQIPIAAQITSIADVYDALVSDRVYKKAYTPEQAYQMILNGECGQFNPKLLHCFRLVKLDYENCARRQKEPELEEHN